MDGGDRSRFGAGYLKPVFDRASFICAYSISISHAELVEKHQERQSRIEYPHLEAIKPWTISSVDWGHRSTVWRIHWYKNVQVHSLRVLVWLCGGLLDLLRKGKSMSSTCRDYSRADRQILWRVSCTRRQWLRFPVFEGQPGDTRKQRGDFLGRESRVQAP